MHDDLPMDVWHRILKTSSAIVPGRADSESVGRKPEQPTADASVAPVQAMRTRRFTTTLRKQRSLFSGRRQSDFLFCEVERASCHDNGSFSWIGPDHAARNLCRGEKYAICVMRRQQRCFTVVYVVGKGRLRDTR
jgi:hypothetical protein